MTTENSPENYYQERKKEFESKRAQAVSRIRFLGLSRLIVFLCTAAAVYFLWGNIGVVLTVAIVGVVLFVWLLSLYSNTVQVKEKFQALIAINEEELKALNGDFSHFDSGEEFADPEHAYSQDIDLFGRSSFFQYLNRTSLSSGKRFLAGILGSNNIKGIDKRQEAVRELAGLSDWRQDYSAEARILKSDVTPETVVKWVKNYEKIVPENMKFIIPVMQISSTAAIVAVLLGFLPEAYLMVWLTVGFGIVGRYLKKINALSIHVGQVQDTFQQYYKLLKRIEEAKFDSSLLKQKQEQIRRESESASEILRSFSKQLDAFDQRNNLLISIPGNGFYLRDLRLLRKIERWIEEHADKVEDWFNVVAFFDGVNSLGNYAFNHQEQVYPELKTGEVQIGAEALGHPLLKAKVRVDNDFHINTDQFFIITGANMAGKSTFLRTVSLSIVMANAGLPVCAEKFSYTPAKLITSMRTSDSLSDNESYFFSELKRLKFVIDTIGKDNHFVILDEILKGTNSKDKAEGSHQFVKKLVQLKSNGIIATHDLSLCTLEQELQEIRNYYFDAEIVNDELFFDYRLKDGVCQNMNASFLLRKMEIV